MSKDKEMNTLAQATAIMREEPPAPKEKVYNATGTPKRRGKRGYTIYIDPVPHGELKEIARIEDTTLEKLTFEGLNYVLQKRGRKAIA
jgi:hypothetical protein